MTYKQGDQIKLEWDIDGVLSEVDVEFTGKTKRNGRVGQWARLDTGKTYSLTKKAVAEMLSAAWEDSIEW